MIAPQSIQQIKDLPIIDVIGNFIRLKQRGTKAEACCPFHSEKSPSFSVNNTMGIYKCFGCGVAGDGIDFVMKHERREFIEAVQLIADTCGVALEITEPADPEAYKQQQTRQQQQSAAIAYATELYHKQLLALPKDHPAVLHLFDRGWTMHTIIKWRLGWCGPDWRQATERLVNDGLYEAAKTIGIIRRTDDGNHYDAYRSRIIFPIQDSRGRYIGLGGRWMPITEKDKASTRAPKYLNSNSDAESIYQKGQTLYGLPQAAAAIRRRGFAWLVEGYADTISMHAFGDANTVGTCGTALTPQQVEQLKKHTKHIVLLRDGDNAGQKAASRDLPLLLQQGIRVSVVSLPDKQDPDDFIRSVKARAA